MIVLCVIPNDNLILCFVQNFRLIADLFLKLDIPNWLKLIIVIFGFACAICKRWLKHKEKMEEQRTDRYRKTVDGFSDIVKSHNLSKSLRFIAGKNEQIESFDKMSYSIDTMLDEFKDLAIAQIMSEFEKNSFEEGAPVREVKKTKRIDFLEKKKRSRRKSE